MNRRVQEPILQRVEAVSARAAWGCREKHQFVASMLAEVAGYAGRSENSCESWSYT